MNKIKEFQITELFGYQNVNLKFENDVLILMGENGLGKTSVLNSIYFTLTQKWKKLLNINFKKISILIDDRKFHFTKEQLKHYLEFSKSRKGIRYKNIKNEIINNIDLQEIINLIEKDTKDDRHKIIFDYVRNNHLNRKLDSPFGLIVELIDEIVRFPNLKSFEDLLNFLDNEFQNNILYFPTYRRVEEELNNLGKFRRFQNDDFPHILWDDDDEKEETEDLEDETLIQFGMQDVEDRIKNIISKINENSIRGFTKVTGEILHQLQEGFPSLSKQDILSINYKNIEIILNRVKNNLSKDDRENILKLLDSEELINKPELAYFLIKLEDVYLQQESLDNTIKNFERVCNEYLVGKEFFYDESSVTLNILNKTTNEKVELKQLSSGEKQIVSLFSKIYFEDYKDIIIFFDEPELSLSIKWQKQLLPHIMESEKCSFLLAVTHSPFIFSNQYEDSVISMNAFIE